MWIKEDATLYLHKIVEFLIETLKDLICMLPQ